MKKMFFHGCLILGVFLLPLVGLGVQEPDPVKGALLHALTFRGDKRERRVIDANEDPGTWRGFLGVGNDYQSLVAGKQTFDRYLNALGTTNCLAMSSLDRQLVRVAIAQCEILAYTNSYDSMKRLALNSNAVHRGVAARLAVKFAPLNVATTTFVESFVTNVTCFPIEDRGDVCCYFANRWLETPTTNETAQIRLAGVARMFYRSRNVDVVGNAIVDDLFKKAIPGYETSSNRLEFVLNALARPTCTEDDASEFSQITNQLLSSGQPLRQLNIGEGDK